MGFSNYLIQWYLQNKRELPWRNSQNPYEIWLSEIILQQTRVAQGLPYFESFLAHFPTVFDLAKASEEQVLKLWQGLGYYSRARNLHQTAKIIAFEKEGQFPKTYNELLELKGIGSYTAAAIASFAYDEAVPVVDGNVFRVLSRYFNVESDISSSKAKNEFTALAKEVMDSKQPALFNQAIMEFGALQCVPKNPDCSVCVFNTSCAALQMKKVQSLPLKLKKTKIAKRFFNYLVFQDANNNSVVNKRTSTGIWHNLYEFPLIETENIRSEKEIVQLVKGQENYNYKINAIVPFDNFDVLHKLSHQHITIRFWRVEIEGELENGLSFDTIKKLPFPIVIYNFIEKNF
ncbi:A/G-specific adenine glycosylase [Flavobacterium sp. UBA6135]|uniref:A/G-specific adenine glycosylase n=1 Tax=Flavobacterium sp. UBA6135 TaxID=1946553 RepID=UPI0025C5A325|nr:A/G-specific adenine glycosylase [Flavobacterium sp. UBA6135]